AILLVPPYDALHDVPSFVRFLVELLVARLVLPCRDHCCHPALSAPAPDAWITIALIPRQAARPALVTAATMEQPLGHGRFKVLALVTLPRRDVDRNQETVAVTNQMDFCSKAATRPSERMIRWLLKLRLLASPQPSGRAGLFFSPRRRLGWPG